MYKDELKDFGNYLVHEILTVDGKEQVHNIGVFKEERIAFDYAYKLALRDPKGDEYYLTPIICNDGWLPGGGTYTCFKKDLKTGKVSYYCFLA